MTLPGVRNIFKALSSLFSISTMTSYSYIQPPCSRTISLPIPPSIGGPPSYPFMNILVYMLLINGALGHM
jgi:hypothetical protein